MSDVLVRVYDDRSDVPQPQGPVALEVPDTASDELVVEQIRRAIVDPTRAAIVLWNGSDVNQGWAVRYED